MSFFLASLPDELVDWRGTAAELADKANSLLPRLNLQDDGGSVNERLVRYYRQRADESTGEAASDPMKAGMATTCTVAAIKGETVILGHVGDCRAYMAVKGQMIQLTADHSMATDYQREGKPLPPEKEKLANVLTRWLGHEGDAAVELSELMQFAVGSTLVMCSDGLTKVVTQDEILHAVSMHLPEGACRRLVELARERGGPDNITVQVARMNRA